MNREESIKLARDIKAKGGVGPKKIGLSLGQVKLRIKKIREILKNC